MLVKNGFDLQYFIEGVRWEENIFSILQCEMNLSSKKKLLIVKLYIFAYVLLLKWQNDKMEKTNTNTMCYNTYIVKDVFIAYFETF